MALKKKLFLSTELSEKSLQRAEEAFQALLLHRGDVRRHRRLRERDSVLQSWRQSLLRIEPERLGRLAPRSGRFVWKKFRKWISGFRLLHESAEMCREKQRSDDKRLETTGNDSIDITKLLLILVNIIMFWTLSLKFKIFRGF